MMLAIGHKSSHMNPSLSTKTSISVSNEYKPAVAYAEVTWYSVSHRLYECSVKERNLSQMEMGDARPAASPCRYVDVPLAFSRRSKHHR